MRAINEPGTPGHPGNQTPTIGKRRTNPLRALWKWLLEDDQEEARPAPTGKPPKAKSPNGKGAAIQSRRARGPAAASHEPEQESYQNETYDGHDPAVDDDQPEPDGEKERTDWRWLTKQFFKSNQRVFVGARLTVLIVLVLSAGWVSMVTVTGFNPVEQALVTPDEDDPKTWFRTPFFIVESGSMMHPDAPFGRLGTVDPGDVVVIEKVENPGDVQTFYGPGKGRTAGARGDVLVFVPSSTKENPVPQPVVHRAVAYLERDIIQVPNPNPAPGGSATVSVPRFTVQEFGIYDARSVTIPELGLYNYQPDRSGFLTRGDNPRTNDLADQALGVTVNPIEHDRVLGRVAHTVPYVGLSRIALMGQDPSQLAPDHQWCSFLAGQAPCDNWVVFLTLLFIFVGVPFTITVIVFTYRSVNRLQERRRFEREQEEAMARFEAERAKQDRDREEETGRPALEAHDALDLLAGRVVPAGPARRAPRRSPDVRIRSGVHFHGGESRKPPRPQID